MQNDEYFRSKEFLAILADYEDCKQRGVSCMISSDDYADVAEYYHIHDGDIVRSEQVVDAAIQLYPGATAPLAFKARLCLLKSDNSQEARRWVQQIEDKYDLEYFYIMAEILIVENKGEEANEYLHECYEQLDNDDDAEDFVYDVACLFCDYNLMEQAEEWVEKASDKEDPDYEEVKARILISRGNFEEGERMLNELLDNNPFAAPYWNSLASSQFQRSAFRDCIDSSEYSLALNPNDDEALLNKANGLYQLGNYHDAADYYLRYSRLRPDDETGELFLAICLLCQDHITEAEEHLKNAETIAEKTHRNLFEIYQELAFTESRLGKLQEALDYVDKTSTLDCDHDEMLVLRGHILLEHGFVEKAQACFTKAIKQSETSPHIFLRIAVSIYDNGYLPLAQKMFTMLLANVDSQTWDEGYSYLAACHHERGNRKEWLHYLKLAVEKNPSEAVNVLSEFFPEGMEPQEYYRFASEEE